MNPGSEGVNLCTARCNNNGVHLRPRQEARKEGPEERVTAPPSPPGPVQDTQGPQPAVRTCVDTTILDRVPRPHPLKYLTGSMGGARRRERAEKHTRLVARIARAAGGRQGGRALRGLRVRKRFVRPGATIMGCISSHDKKSGRKDRRSA